MIFSKNGQKCTKIYQKEGNIFTVFGKGIDICVTMVGVNLYNVCAADFQMASDLDRGTGRTFCVAKFVWYHFIHHICANLSFSITTSKGTIFRIYFDLRRGKWPETYYFSKWSFGKQDFCIFLSKAFCCDQIEYWLMSQKAWKLTPSSLFLTNVLFAKTAVYRN